MRLLASVVFTAGVLLATQKYKMRLVLPLTGLFSLIAGKFFDLAVGLAPFMGLIAGLLAARRKSYGQILTAAVAPGAGLSLWLLIAQNSRSREILVEEAIAQLQALGLQEPNTDYSLREIVEAVARLQPAIEFLSLLFSAILAYRLGIWAANRLGFLLPEVLPFRLWRPWDELLWVLIAALALGLIGSGWMAELALNLTAVMAVLYAVHGLALVRYFAWRRGLSWWLESLLYIALFFASGLALISLGALGLLDLWFDWRHLQPTEAPKEVEE